MFLLRFVWSPLGVLSDCWLPANTSRSLSMSGFEPKSQRDPWLAEKYITSQNTSQGLDSSCWHFGSHTVSSLLFSLWIMLHFFHQQINTAPKKVYTILYFSPVNLKLLTGAKLCSLSSRKWTLSLQSQRESIVGLKDRGRETELQSTRSVSVALRSIHVGVPSRVKMNAYTYRSQSKLRLHLSHVRFSVHTLVYTLRCPVCRKGVCLDPLKEVSE